MERLFKLLSVVILLSGVTMFSSCGDDDVPPEENTEEEINRVVATFVNEADPSDVVTATWFDADGEGTIAPVIDDIVLSSNSSYYLTLELSNTLVDPVEDITGEVIGEAEEHMFFFAFTESIFSDPEGNGNIDNRSDNINYEDMDSNSDPLGIETAWTTAVDEQVGTFSLMLKHQPDIKSATSTSSDGETDVDITFNLIIE